MHRICARSVAFVLTVSVAFLSAAGCRQATKDERAAKRQSRPDSAQPVHQDPAQAAGILADAGVTGGLVVHVGCGDGTLTAALRAGDSYLVHGLDSSAANVEKARAHIAGKGLAEKVSVARWSGPVLPYVDNLVNLIVVEDANAIAMPEVLRVLAPNGVAMVRSGDGWTRTVKPRPKEIDEWTHFLHGPDNNAVANDTVSGPPRHLQWAAGPEHARSHEHFGTLSAMVSSGGRVFYIVDEGPTAAVGLPARWRLVARDAFSGVLLWKRPIAKWESHLRQFRGGPAWLARRLVAMGDRVYVTLGYGEPVSVLDAASGRTVKAYDGTDGAAEILIEGGVLYVVITDDKAEAAAAAARRQGKETAGPTKVLMALDVKTGKQLWKKADADTVDLQLTTAAVSGSRVVFQNVGHVVCLNAKDGKVLWRAKRETKWPRPEHSPPTLVVQGDVVLSADHLVPYKPGKDPNEKMPMGTHRGKPGETAAFSLKNGRRLWTGPCYLHFNSPVDVLVVDGQLWSGDFYGCTGPGFTEARDITTGAPSLKRPADDWRVVAMAHHRCYRNRATSRYVVTGRAGVELVDVKTGKTDWNHWLRGTCQFGVLPCNGLLYVPPHACACYAEAMFPGFNAMATNRAKRPAAQTARLEKGPAYGEIDNRQSTMDNPSAWPTYRGNAARSGATTGAVPAKLKSVWQTTVDGKLSAPTVAEGKVFVASVDTHTVVALDAATGNIVWRRTVGGRVDSPPTIWNGRAIFGSADGWIYCLRATDGRLFWRFRTGPEDLRLVARGQIESVWPVHGSVLVDRGVVYAAAGRSSFLDGGLCFVRLDAATGKVLSDSRVSTRDPKTGAQPLDEVVGFDIPGVLPDVLSAVGEHVFMRHSAFDREGNYKPKTRIPHLFSTVGFLDDSWWHRTYWQYSARMGTGFRDWGKVSKQLPTGRLLVYDDATLYGFGRSAANQQASHIGVEKTRHRLFAAAAGAEDRKKWAAAQGWDSVATYRWTRSAGLLVRAMVLARDTLFIAGPPDFLDREKSVGLSSPLGPEGTAALAGKMGATLLAVSAPDGKTLAELKLKSPPVFDGLAAAAERLYMTTLDGHVVCFGSGAMTGKK